MIKLKSQCHICKKEFLYYPLHSKGMFCSNKCRKQYQSKNTVYSKCKFCKKETKTEYKRWVAGKGKYCSKKCYSLSMMKNEHKKDRASINRDYRKNHPLKWRMWKHKRRMLELELGGFITPEEWLLIVKKHKNKCAECKKETILTIDHIIPVSRWKEWIIKNPHIKYLCGDKENIQPLCRSCNARKNDSIKI